MKTALLSLEDGLSSHVFEQKEGAPPENEEYIDSPELLPKALRDRDDLELDGWKFDDDDDQMIGRKFSHGT